MDEENICPHCLRDETATDKLEEELAEVEGLMERVQQHSARRAERMRVAAQILIKEIGAEGPERVEETAKRAAKVIRKLRKKLDDAELQSMMKEGGPTLEDESIKAMGGAEGLGLKKVHQHTARGQAAPETLGLYRLTWKKGGSSLASVGQDGHGRRWFSASNWIGGMPCFDWSVVETIHQLFPVDDGSEAGF